MIKCIKFSQICNNRVTCFICNLVQDYFQDSIILKIRLQRVTLENLKVCKNVNIKFRTIQFLFETFFNIFGKQVYYFR